MVHLWESLSAIGQKRTFAEETNHRKATHVRLATHSSAMTTIAECKILSGEELLGPYLSDAQLTARPEQSAVQPTLFQGLLSGPATNINSATMENASATTPHRFDQTLSALI